MIPYTLTAKTARHYSDPTRPVTMTHLDTWLLQISPYARVLSVESMIIEYGDGDIDFTLDPVCEICGDKYDVAHHEPGYSPHVGPWVSYQHLVMRIEAPGYETGEVLAENGRSCRCCNDCKSHAEKRLLKDRIAIAEEAIRLIPVTDVTQSLRSRLIQVVSDLVEEAI